MRRLIACLALALSAVPAAACINDSELKTHEREFRSQYGQPAPPPSAPTSAEPVGSLPVGRIAAVAGLVLLAGATVVAWRGAPARA